MSKLSTADSQDFILGHFTEGYQFSFYFFCKSSAVHFVVEDKKKFVFEL